MHKVLVKPYVAEEHGKYMNLLCMTQDMSMPDFIPKLGAIAFMDCEVVACGFIRKAEGNMGIWDGLITRANAPKHIRHQGLTELVDYLILQAREYDINRIICWTNDESVIQRGFDVGFRRSECQLMALDVKG